MLCWGKAGLCVVGDCCVGVKLVSVWWEMLCWGKAGLCVVGDCCVMVKLVSVWLVMMCGVCEQRARRRMCCWCL